MTAQARFWSSIALAAPLALGLAAPAHAETVLATPGITAPIGDSLRCRIVNVGTKPIKVDIELVYGSGSIYHQEVVVPPSGLRTTGIYNLSVEVDGYCRFIGNFTRALVRASIEKYSASAGSMVVVAPAQ